MVVPDGASTSNTDVYAITDVQLWVEFTAVALTVFCQYIGNQIERSLHVERKSCRES